MGGAVSSGRDNNELVDNLMSGNYIRTRAVENVFRVLDRADYMSPEARDQAYRDLAWRNGPLHLSAPCIYSEVMEALELKQGLSFLNVGSGTGYLSTMVGLILGSSGISHGIEALPFVLEYANKKLSQFIDNSAVIDEFDFCTPKYYGGNGLCLAPAHLYDRVYCGAGVQPKYENYFKQLTKVGGVLVMPLAETLVQYRRVTDSHWTRRNLLNVSFALLREPHAPERDEPVKLEEQKPAALQALCRGVIRGAMRRGLYRRHPEMRPPPPPPPRAAAAPRRIRIPCEPTSDEELNELHELDEAGGAHEMNALLSLVLSMGQHRGAGSLRLDAEADAPPPRRPDGVIVFDVAAGRARRARRRRPRAAQDAEPERAARARSEEATSSSAARPAASSSPDTASEAEPRGAGTRAATDSDARAGSTGTESDARAGSTGTESDARPDSPGPRSWASRLRPRARWLNLSSEDEDISQAKDNKRAKLDSGIGEGTVSSGGSPDKSDDKSDDKSATECLATNSDDEGIEDNDVHRYSPMLWYEDESSSGSSESEAGEEQGATTSGAPPARAHSPPANTGGAETSRRSDGRRRGAARGRRGRDDGSARRVRLSLAMKRAVKELPLPPALKSYINYGRCYQF